MALTKTRIIAGLLGANSLIAPDSDFVNTSYDKGVAVSSGTMSVYSSIDSLPVSASTGKKALVTSTNTLYIYNNGWYKIAIINNFNPQWITQPNSTYDLAINGTATTITVVASDSDDVPITYTAVTDSDFNLIATVTHDSDKHNTWTIVPLDSENGAATGGTGTITFKASDGVNLVSAVSTFSLTFGPDWSSPTESILINPVVIAGGYAYNSPQFGIGVSISTDGNYAAVGARSEYANSSTNGGAVYIYTRSGSTWTQQARLVGSTVSTDYRFGNSVSINSDGTYLLVGAYGKNYNVGTAYVFTRSGSTWTQQAEIPSPTATADLFGFRSAINSTGDLVAICAQGNPGAGAAYTQSGAVHVYSRSGSTWTLQQTLRASDENSYWRFGRSAKFNSDGTYIIIGAPMSFAGTGNGAAYIFTRSGSTWTQQAKITAADAQVDDFFGGSVSMNSDASYVAVTALGEDGGAGDPLSLAGAAYVFSRSGSTWTEQAKITASDAQANDQYGNAIDISGDGKYVIAGSWGEDGGAGDPLSSAGQVYIYEAG